MTARHARVPAYAKINLTLGVLWKQPNGYHDIATVMQTIDLCDWLDISVEEGDAVEVTASIDIPGTNIAERAAKAVLEALGRRARVRIHIEKQIPLGGGLGGSSTDGSAVLLALPRLLGEPLDFDFLDPLAAALGSDLNFLLRGGTRAAWGRGVETWEVRPVSSFSGKLWVPGFASDSKVAYAALGRRAVAEVPAGEQAEARRLFDQLLARMEREPLVEWAGDCRNDFEDFVFSEYPELAQKREEMARGAALARMSGSGSTLFSLWEGEREGADFRSLSRAEFVENWERALAAPAR